MKIKFENYTNQTFKPQDAIKYLEAIIKELKSKNHKNQGLQSVAIIIGLDKTRNCVLGWRDLEK